MTAIVAVVMAVSTLVTPQERAIQVWDNATPEVRRTMCDLRTQPTRATSTRKRVISKMLKRKCSGRPPVKGGLLGVKFHGVYYAGRPRMACNLALRLS